MRRHGFHLEFPRYFEGPVPAGLVASSLKADIFMGLDSGKAEVMLFVTEGGLE